MSNNELLTIEPSNLEFHFELKKQISCSFYLTNKTDNNVAFKVKTTNPRNYCVTPNSGVVLPRLTYEVRVTMQAQNKAPYNMQQPRDKFMIQAIKASPRVTANEVTHEMFTQKPGRLVEQAILRVAYAGFTGPPSPIHQGPANVYKEKKKNSKCCLCL